MALSYYNTATEAVWMAWTTTSASTTVDTSGNAVWGRWVQVGTSASATCTCNAASEVWLKWHDCTTGELHPQPVLYYRPAAVQTPPPPLTAEQQRARDEELKRQREEYEKKLAEEKAKREAAEKRAKGLLMSLLSKEQREQFKKRKAFQVVGSDGARFEIKEGWAGNVVEMNEDGKPINRFCIHPASGPHHDNLIAQKLMLETDAERFRKTANRTALPV